MRPLRGGGFFSGMTELRNMRGPGNLLYPLLISLWTTDALKVTMKAPLISVMRDEDVTIPCEFTEFNVGKTINVGWKKSQNGKSSDVYIYIPGRAQSFRPGAYMEAESEIQKGNAALHIPRVQYSDDGEYICTVVVTPEDGEGKSTLQVKAVPSAVLIPGDDIMVALGSEKVVSCDVTYFYPKDINIRWVRHEKYSSKCVVLEKGTCTGDTANNTDGTFNTTSQLTLYPTMADTGHIYSCVVKHRSLDQDLKMNFTLTVTEREDITGKVVTAVILTILSFTLLLLAGFLYYQVFTKDPPSLSEITGNDQLIDMTRTTLTCHMMNFKPNDLEISIHIKRSGEKMETIHTWRSRDPDPSAGAVMNDNDGEGSVAIDLEQQRLISGAVSHTQGPLQLKMTPVITPNRSGLLRCIQWRRLYTYSCQCFIHITPSYSEDYEAEVSVYVSHPALKDRIHQTRILNVIGVAPTLLKIVSPVYMTHEEPMTLTCPINGFKPKPLQITWVKKDKSDRETEIITWNSNDRTDKNDLHNVTENEHKDKSYSFLSALMMRPNVREDGFIYICRISHPATDHWAQEEHVLKVTAVPVLGPITQTLGKTKINVGDTMSLSCKIHSFYPKPIEVTWYTEDGGILPSNLSDFLPDQSGRYHVTSLVTYTPTMKDRGKTITCDVKHESTRAPKTATWTLKDLVSEPTVSEIRCDPPSPECNKTVTLSCHVSDLCYDKSIAVIWHKGINRIHENMCRKSIHEDPESGTFQGTIELHFDADYRCHEEEYRMELNHSGKTIVRKYKLILKGFPVLSDITSEPRNPIYGHPVTLSCKVTNAKPQDIKVQWTKGEKPLGKGQGEEKQITEEDGSVSCSLRIRTTTALDYGKDYTCSVRHKDMKETIRKNHYIALPVNIPVFSEITVRPERPVAGQEAIFTVTICGFTPDIEVRWYKDFGPFPSDVVTTSDPEIGKDFLCTCSSSLRFTSKDNDHAASIRCEATHSLTKKVYETSYNLLLAGNSSEKPEKPLEKGSLKTPLKTQGIQCLTESPRVGDEVTLTCYVHGCDANDSVFYWRKGLFPIESGIQKRTLEDRTGSFSTVTFTAQEKDRDCTIFCEVTYNLETLEERFTLKLQ
ncbi:uncharacterized protein LOC130344663 [Hyla sarda]|uniref:uncharacterized protein LOC130344663 n=1 Tax=Hyla sarda TaxID=327740 RepID=UPI0024C2CE63|nr:uncharacterized protein LOC130344663 [Hyla sarda]